MEYLALALKYRPRTFEEVIGQDHAVKALKNAIFQNRVHHAYLFSGPRGVGKTSLARIFAKALNCEKGPTASPCEKCLSCEEILRGASLDIIEIDGASNRGIDDIRSLRESAKLTPAHSRYKIYIIDEVHQISHDGFNALLKTLEEPPAHVKFIFATTHPQKVPATILSRCQKFQFNLVSTEQIVDKLKKIIAQEKINIDESLLYVAARSAAGSIRDAESLLDQLLPVMAEKETIKDIMSFLGIIDEDSLNRALGFLVKKDIGGMLVFIDATLSSGKDLGVFVNALIEHSRNLLLAKVCSGRFNELSDLSPQSKTVISQFAGQMETAGILRMIELLIEAKEQGQRLNSMRVPLELALIKFCCDVKAADIPVPIKIEEPQTKPAPEPAKQTVQEFDQEIDAIGADFEVKKQAGPAQEESLDIDIEAGQDNDDILLPFVQARWKEILADLLRVRAALASHLGLAQPVSSCGKMVRIAFEKKYNFHKEIVESSKNLMFLETAISRFMGREVRLQFVLVDKSPAGQTPGSEKTGPVSEPGTAKSDDGSGSEDFLNELLDTFGGQLDTGE